MPGRFPPRRPDDADAVLARQLGRIATSKDHFRAQTIGRAPRQAPGYARIRDAGLYIMKPRLIGWLPAVITVGYVIRLGAPRRPE